MGKNESRGRDALTMAALTLAGLAVFGVIAFVSVRPGADVRILTPGESVRAKHSAHVGRTVLLDGDHAPVEVGDRMEVLDDPGPVADGVRGVRVRISEGRHRGFAGYIHRSALRPAG